MDKIGQYRILIKNILQEEADLMNSQPVPGEEVDCVFDEARDHYLLLKFGWPRGKYAHYTRIHARLHNGKIWIESDLTEEGLATQLVAAGVPKEDIVLAFNAPELRPHSEFAAA